MEMYQLENDLKKELEERKSEILESRYPEDEVIEIADSWVPIYNGELADCLLNDLSLSDLEDSGLGEGVTNIFDRIKIAIYERLSTTVYQWLEEATQDLD